MAFGLVFPIFAGLDFKNGAGLIHGGGDYGGEYCGSSFAGTGFG